MNSQKDEDKNIVRISHTQCRFSPIWKYILTRELQNHIESSDKQSRIGIIADTDDDILS